MIDDSNDTSTLEQTARQTLPLERERESGSYLWSLNWSQSSPVQSSPVPGPELEVSVASDFPVYQDKNAVASLSRRVGSDTAGYEGLCWYFLCGLIGWDSDDLCGYLVTTEPSHLVPWYLTTTITSLPHVTVSAD